MALIKRKLTPGDIFLITANLLPIYGVAFLGWNAIDAFIVYALETLIIGVITVMKIALVTFVRKKDQWYNQGTTTSVSGLFFIAFFILHFGLFAAVQTSIFSETAGITKPGKGMLHFFFHWYEYINKDIAIMLGTITFGHLARSFVPFVLSGEYKTVSMMKLMFQPYGRIFVQQFTVILGSMLLIFKWQTGFMIVFAAVKIFFEMIVHFDGIISRSLDDLEKQSTNNK